MFPSLPSIYKSTAFALFTNLPWLLNSLSSGCVILVFYPKLRDHNNMNVNQNNLWTNHLHDKVAMKDKAYYKETIEAIDLVDSQE